MDLTADGCFIKKEGSTFHCAIFPPQAWARLKSACRSRWLLNYQSAKPSSNANVGPFDPSSSAGGAGDENETEGDGEQDVTFLQDALQV